MVTLLLGHCAIMTLEPENLPPCLAEHVTACFECGFADLAVALDRVDVDANGVKELGDALGTLVPSHDAAAIFKDLDK